MKEKIKVMLSDAAYFLVWVLLAAVALFLVIGIISWLSGWRTFAQYATALMYTGIAIVFFGPFMFQGNSTHIQQFQPHKRSNAVKGFMGRGLRHETSTASMKERFDEAAKYGNRIQSYYGHETNKELMQYRIDGAAWIVFFILVGALMILCSLFIRSYLVI